MKKIISFALVLMLSFSLCASALADSSAASSTTNITTAPSPGSAMDSIISAYFSAINNKQYTEIANMSPSKDRDMMTAIYTNEINADNHVGLFNIASISLDKTRWDVSDMLTDYVDEAAYTEYTEAKTGLIAATVNYEEESFGLHNGQNYFCAVLVNEQQNWYVADLILVDKAYAQMIMSDVNMCGVDTPISSNILYTPTEIKVCRTKQYSGESASVLNTIVTVNFKEYCYICLQNEFGKNTYSSAAREAVAIAVKCFAFHRYLYNNSISKGYHITDSSASAQCYNPTVTPTSKTQTAVDNTWNYFVLDARNRIFPTFHSAGSSNNAGQYGGRLKQLGAEYLATNNSYTRDEILHYYYDNLGSNYYNSEVASGAVSVHKHTTTTISTTTTTHRIKCSSCGNEHQGAHEYSTSYMKCIICNYKP